MIRNLMRNKEYPNVHADISFTVHDKGLYPILKNLLQSSDSKNYVLFGSDFYMMQKDYRERRFSMDVRGYLDDDDYVTRQMNDGTSIPSFRREQRSTSTTITSNGNVVVVRPKTRRQILRDRQR